MESGMMDNRMNQENRQVLYMGNLRCDVAKRDIVNNILDLFNYYIGIAVTYEDITLHTNKSRSSSYAFVNVHSEHQAEYALDQLSSWDRRRQLKYKFTLLCEGSQPLQVSYKRENQSKQVKKKKKKKKNLMQDTEDDDLMDRYDDQYFPSPAVRSKQFSSLPFHGNSARALFSVSEPNSISHIKMNTVAEVPEEVYYEGHKLGNESRNVEFKSGGGGYLKKKLKEHVAKYVCGFLNSGESGILYIGVTDDGSVVGTECDQGMEDDVRCWIDQAITSIKPFLLPNMYSVTFTPVYIDAANPKENYKVIEISVAKTGEIERLYDANGSVFLRRDGSIQGPLKPSEIQEWTSQKFMVKMNKMKEENTSEVNRLKERIDRQEEQLKEKMRRSPEHREEKKSKVCAIQ